MRGGLSFKILTADGKQLLAQSSEPLLDTGNKWIKQVARSVISLDGGGSWQSSPKWNQIDISSLQADPHNSNIFYARQFFNGQAEADSALLKSEDNAETWQFLNHSDSLQAWPGGLHFTSEPKLLYATGHEPDDYDSVLLRSTNEGESWFEVAPAIGRRARGLTVTGDDILYLTTQRGQLFKSVDDARSWIPIKPSSPIMETILPVISASRFDTVFVYTSSSGLIKTTDEGTHWQTVIPDSSVNDTQQLIVAGTGSEAQIYALTSIGIYEYSGGSPSWQKVSDHIAGWLVVDPNDPKIFYSAGPKKNVDTSEGSLFRSIDAGKNWHEINGELSKQIRLHTVPIFINQNNSKHLTLFGAGKLFRSYDSGLHWEPIKSTGFPLNVSPSTIQKTPSIFAINPHQPESWYLIFDNEIYLSLDSGGQWDLLGEVISTPTTGTGWRNSINRIWVSHANSDIMYASATVEGGLSVTVLPPKQYHLYKTTNGGINWQDIGEFCCVHSFTRQTLLLMDSRNSDFLIQTLVGQGAVGHYASRSLDGGQTWRPFGNALASPFNSIIFGLRGSDTLFAGSSDGIFELTRKFKAVHESPATHSTQSGIGLIRGWVCDADKIEVQIDDLPPFNAAYGSERDDTIIECGDSNNGYGLTVNWNLLGDGRHRVRVSADGKIIADKTFQVTTLGATFIKGLDVRSSVADFPKTGRNTAIRWSTAHQNFMLDNDQANVDDRGHVSIAEIAAFQESPGPGSFESGIGLIRGWACDAKIVTIQIDETRPIKVVSGTTRGDTAGVCESTDSGYGYTINWNLLGAGQHSLRAFADDVLFADFQFNVATLGTDFLLGKTKTHSITGFPITGDSITLQWSQLHQNFIINEYQSMQ